MEPWMKEVDGTVLPAGLLESGQGDKIWVAVWTDHLTAPTSATYVFIKYEVLR
jgi:hypothetical protein